MNRLINLLEKLFPLNRSITGEGLRQTLQIIKNEIGQLDIHNIPSGTKVFDWVVPDEWNCKDAYILQPDGNKICEYSKNNLYLLGYSAPINKTVDFSELETHLYSLPEYPNAIPYVTSYYDKKWGFCIEEKIKEKLKTGKYKVFIDSKFFKGNLTYGELFIPSTRNTNEEVFFSTYVCHPSMANNELSGPVMMTFLAKWLLNLKQRRFNYRIIFIPETIGSIAYLSRHWKEMKKNIIAGFNITCVGDERCYSYLPTRLGNTLSDNVALHILKHEVGEFINYTFLDRGSDERQYCSPGIDLPIATICRSKYHEYPEYHTSEDKIGLVTNKGLQGSLELYKKILTCIEENVIYKNKIFCEPFMTAHDLYPKTGTKNAAKEAQLLMDILTYSDGDHSLLEIAELLEVSVLGIIDPAKLLYKKQLLGK